MAAKYSKKFDINLSDLEMIENALRDQAKQLSQKKLEQLEMDKMVAEANPYLQDPEMTAIQTILGKLHNQKMWYTPQQYVPRG